MTLQYSAHVQIELASTKLARTVYLALIPEQQASTSPVTRVHVDSDGCVVTLHLAACSIATLRALINSYLRWTVTIQAVLDSVVG
jgi:tRNA threonylcarbamoyladenosine modification (KEOPS) complex  Pcc1 subunit